MILASTTDKLTVDMSSTADIVAIIEYAIGDKTSSPMVIKDADTKVFFSISATAAQDLLGAFPGANERWQITKATFINIHASASNTLGLKYIKAGGTARAWCPPFTLAAGESVECDKNGVWFAYDAGRRVKVGGVAGAFIAQTEFSAGTTFTTGPNTNKIILRMVGAGGGGSGCTSVAAAAAAGGGGGAGGYAEKEFPVTPNTAYTYAIGAAGTGASGAAGNNGGDTTFTGPGAVTVTAKGGSGAPIGTAATTLVARAGGAGGTVSTGGDVNSGGAPGDGGVTLIVATPILLSGNGGSSQFGSGGLGLVAAGNGNNGLGFGAGGGGSATGASAVRTGGNGTGGFIVVEEYT